MTTSKGTLKTFHGIVRVLLFYVGSLIIFAIVSGVAKGRPNADYASLTVSSLLTFGLIISFAKWEKLTLPEIGIGFESGSVLRFAGGFGLGVAMVLVQAVITTMFAKVTFVLSSDISLLDISLSLVLYLLVAVREELVFRTYMLRNMSNLTSPLVALITITIVFILEHVIAGVSWKMSVVGSGFGGILFGLAALKTRGIALPLGIHFAWNFSQWMLGFKNDTGVWREVVTRGAESSAENVALLGFTVAMSLGIFCVLIVVRRKTGPVGSGL